MTKKKKTKEPKSGERQLAPRGKGLSLQFLKFQDCRGPACPINDECPYLKEGVKCRVEEAFYQPIIALFDKERGIGDVVDQLTVSMFNQSVMHLVRHLFKFVISERAIKGDITYKSKVGRWYIYPQFEEIRRTMQSITLQMKALGIFEKWEKKFGPRNPVPVPSSQEVDDVLQTGRRGAYEEMASMGNPGEEEEE